MKEKYLIKIENEAESKTEAHLFWKQRNYLKKNYGNDSRIKILYEPGYGYLLSDSENNPFFIDKICISSSKRTSDLEVIVENSEGRRPIIVTPNSWKEFKLEINARTGLCMSLLPKEEVKLYWMLGIFEKTFA